MSSSSKTFLHGSIISFIGVGIMGIFNYLIRREMALELSLEDYGFFYSAMSLIMLVLAVLDLGLSKSGTILMTNQIALKKNPEANNIFNQILYIKLTAGFLFFALFAASSSCLMEYYFKYDISSTFFIALVVMIPFAAVETVPIFALEAIQSFAIKNIVQCLKIVIMYVAVYFAVSGYGLGGAITAFVCSTSIGFIINLLVLKNKTVFHFSTKLREVFDTIKGTLSFSKWIAISTSCTTAIYFMDSIMLTWMADLQSVALYNIALPITQIFQAMMILPVVFTPIAAELWQKKKYSEIIKPARLVTALTCAAVLIVSVGGYFFSGTAITLLFAAEFSKASTSLTILCVGVTILSLGQFYINILNVAGKVKLAAIITIAGVIFNVIANFVLIPLFNITGAAVATLLTYILMTLLYLYEARRILSRVSSV